MVILIFIIGFWRCYKIYSASFGVLDSVRFICYSCTFGDSSPLSRTPFRLVFKPRITFSTELDVGDSRSGQVFLRARLEELLDRKHSSRVTFFFIFDIFLCYRLHLRKKLCLELVYCPFITSQVHQEKTWFVLLLWLLVWVSCTFFFLLYITQFFSTSSTRPSCMGYL